MFFNIRSASLPFLLVLLIIGCNSGPRTYPVTGTVNYDGQPLAQGLITFTPDGTAGNAGISSAAEIKSGSFSVPQKFGVVGGAYRIFVESSESLGEDAGNKELFTPFSMNYNFPTGSSTFTLSVDVPKGGGSIKTP